MRVASTRVSQLRLANTNVLYFYSLSPSAQCCRKLSNFCKVMLTLKTDIWDCFVLSDLHSVTQSETSSERLKCSKTAMQYLTELKYSNLTFWIFYDQWNPIGGIIDISPWILFPSPPPSHECFSQIFHVIFFLMNNFWHYCSTILEFLV